MANQSSFSVEFKRQVIQELLSGESTPAQLCRRHNIGSSLLYHWKRQYSRGKFENEPTEEAALKDRVEKLERLVGKLDPGERVSKKGALEQIGSAAEKRALIARWRPLVSCIRWGVSSPFNGHLLT